MNNYLDNHNKKDCCGCSACTSSCPVSCIEMKRDEDGFLFPVVKDASKCIDCKLCQKVCPMENPLKHEDDGQYYGAYSSQDELVKKCSSGGIFAELANMILREDGYVFGAAFDDKLSLAHRCYSRGEDLNPVYSSKYLQSDMKDCYSLCKKLLTDGKKVLFSGTPCQISGLHRFLRKEYDNLFTVDVICHGVPSESFFHAYVDSLEKKHKGKLTFINFRDKRKNGWSITLRYIINRKGKDYIYDLNRRESSYFTFFLKGLIARESCYTCPFASMNRPGDLTLGDFWGYQRTRPELKHELGLSLVLSNTPKGNQMIKELQGCCDVFFAPVNEESIRVSDNKNLYVPTKRPDFRNTIYVDLRANDYFFIEKKYFQLPSRMSFLLNKLRNIAAKIKHRYGR